MNLAHLFEIQRKLDQHIIEKKGLEGQDLLPQKILALQVELGELANEWRGFKFWSNDQEPRKSVYYGPPELPDVGTYVNPMLEEYVDCLHFILSIGLEFGFENMDFELKHQHDKNVLALFIILFMFSHTFAFDDYAHDQNYRNMVSRFYRLGELLGFTWEQVEQAYLEKNRVNYQRQESGY